MHESDSEIARLIMKEEPDYSQSTWKGISQEAKSFVQQALQKDPAKRPSI